MRLVQWSQKWVENPADFHWQNQPRRVHSLLRRCGVSTEIDEFSLLKALRPGPEIATRLPRIVTTCHDMSPGHRDIVGLFFDAEVCPWVGHPGPWISLWDLSQTLQLWLQSGRGKDLSGAWKRLGDDRWQKSLLYEVLYCNLWRYVKV